MRIIFIILSILFIVLSIAFTILPMGTLAFLPLALALMFAFLAFIKSKANQKKLSIWLIVISTLATIVVSSKIIFTKDIVVEDKAFEVTKEDSKNEAISELEELEELEELDELEGLE